MKKENFIKMTFPAKSVNEGYARAAVAAFAATLEQNGIRATVRRRLGADINASCGQLRRDSMQEQSPTA